MKKAFFYSMGLLALFGLAVMGGCGSKKNRISIAGSTSVQPIAETLAEEYLKRHRQMSVNIQGGGSSAGIKAVKDGTVDIGTSSRLLKPEEQAGLTAVEIARDGIAIIVHPNNRVANLSLNQIRAIFSGKVTNWSAVGGSAAAIVVVNREEGSGTRSAFVDAVMHQTSMVKTLVQGSTGAVRQTVAGDPNAIGYISLAGLDQTVKSLAVNGVPCDVVNIKSQKYRVFRPFLFVYKKPETPEVKALIDYVVNDGQEIVKANGLVSIK